MKTKLLTIMVTKIISSSTAIRKQFRILNNKTVQLVFVVLVIFHIPYKMIIKGN
jgi:hypothetical protein